MRKTKLLLFVIISIGILSSCSKFTKILKEPDPEIRYNAAIAYYEEGECYKSLTILEDLLPLYRGTAKSEDVYYYFAKSHFCEKDYLLSGFYFKQFVKTFPQSKYSEECSYLAALCSYKESPNSNLDQSETDNSLSDLQFFLDKYPQTEKKDTINSLITILKDKLELKEFNSANVYLKTLRYKAAVIAYNNFLKEYPATKYREDVMFNIVKANYLLAINSIDKKKSSRLKDTIESYHNFAVIFPESERADEALNYSELAQKELDKKTINN